MPQNFFYFFQVQEKLDAATGLISGFLSPFISTSVLETTHGRRQGGAREQCPAGRSERLNARRLMAAPPAGHGIYTALFHLGSHVHQTQPRPTAVFGLAVQKFNGFCVFFRSQTYTFFIYLTEMSRNCIAENVLTIMKSANSCCGSRCLR